MNIQSKLFEIEPLHIKEINFDKYIGELHIYIAFLYSTFSTRTDKEICKNCKISLSRHFTVFRFKAYSRFVRRNKQQNTRNKKTFKRFPQCELFYFYNLPLILESAPASMSLIPLHTIGEEPIFCWLPLTHSFNKVEFYHYEKGMSIFF